MADPKRIISFDINGDMTVVVDSKQIPVTIRVGQVERVQALMDARKDEPADFPEKRWSGLPGMVRWNYDILEVILNDDIEKPRYSRSEIEAKIPVHHATMMVNDWMSKMLYNPGEKKDQAK